MKITDLVKTSTEPFISIEIIPPRKGVRLETLFAELEALMRHTPAFMSVTSHAHEWSIEKVDGKDVERMKHKRLDTNAICIAAQARFAREIFTGVYDSDMGLWVPDAAAEACAPAPAAAPEAALRPSA